MQTANMWGFTVFSPCLQSSWVIQVELAIGPEEGISYLTDKGSAVSKSLYLAVCFRGAI